VEALDVPDAADAEDGEDREDVEDFEGEGEDEDAPCVFVVDCPEREPPLEAPGFAERALPEVSAPDERELTLPGSPACDDPPPEGCAVCDLEDSAPVEPPGSPDERGAPGDDVLAGAGAAQGRAEDNAADAAAAAGAGRMGDVNM
jgi:hypothetical protein